MKSYYIKELQLEKILTAEVLLGDELPLGNIGTGYSEIVPITGGSVEGKVSGKILDFGGDWGLLHSDVVNVLDTKYIIETDDKEYISVSCTGKLIMDYDTMIAASEGETEVEDYYFRQVVNFTTGAEKYKWLNNIVAVATSIITPENNVYIEVYQLT